MEDQAAILDDNISVKSESVGCRSPPSLSPVVSVPSSASPSSPPPPLLSAPHLSIHGHSPQGHHTPPIFQTSPPISRPPFLPALYFSHAYASPPPIHTSDPTANDCKLVEYKGQKVAAFMINGDSMLCLPQVFELFLKNLVGGLHTVYTKLKRLGIEPIVCNVEQVRVLRGLGAIQPGVNRCKLLSIKHFDILYKDCTTARRDRLSSLLHDRPGRPPKRPHEILGLGLTGHLPHGAIPPQHLSHEALMALKKSRMDGRDFSPFMNGGGVSHDELEKSPLLSNGYNPPPKALMAQYMALNGGIPHPALFAHSGMPLPPHPAAPWPQHPQEHPFKSAAVPHDNLARTMAWENCRASYDEVIKHLEKIREDRSRNDRVLGLCERDDHLERTHSPHKTNGYGESDVLNLSKSESRDDLSDPGNAPLMASGSSPRDLHDDKDDPLSDNDSFDDKNDLSDREDYGFQPRDFQARALHVSLSAEANNNIISNNLNNNNLLCSVNSLGKNISDSISSHSNSSNMSSNEVTPSSKPSTNMLTSASDHTISTSGLNLSGGLMGLGLGLVVGCTPSITNNMSTSTSVNTNCTINTNGPDRGSVDITMGSIGSPSTASTPLGVSTPHPPLSSLENLLGNIQNLLKVAAESVRHEEKQWYREKEHLRLEFLRQKEMRERMEKQLAEDEKLKMLYLRKLKREKRVRRKLEEQLTDKLKRLSQYEPSTKDFLSLRTSESMKSAVAAAVAVASAATVASNSVSANQAVTSGPMPSRCYNAVGQPENPLRLSPKTQNEVEALVSQSQNVSEAAPLYFSKPMLFNCSV